MWTHRLFASLSRVIVIGGDDVIMMVISTLPGARRCLTASACVCVFVSVYVCAHESKGKAKLHRHSAHSAISIACLCLIGTG